MGRARTRPRAGTSPLPAYAHLPLLVNERGKKLSKRRDPVAVEMYREQGYLPEAFRNYLALLGWSPGDEEIVPVETLIERFRLEDVQRSPAFFDVKKLSHIDGVYIRALPVDEFIAAARPWVDPVPGEWAPGGWRDPDTGAPAVEPPPWAPERFDAEKFAALAAVAQERVAVLGEVPELVDFLFLADAPIDDDSWQKAIAGDELAPRILADALAAYETCPWDKDSLHEVTLAIAEAVGRKLGKAQAPIRVAVMGRTRGLPLFDSLAVLGREETCRRLAAALARLRPGRLMLLAPLRWALRIAVLFVAVIVLYFAVTLVQVWLTSRQYDPHPAAAILVHGGGAVRLRPVPGPAGAPRPGGDALPPGLRPPHHGDREQGAEGQVHRGPVGRDVPRVGQARADVGHPRGGRQQHLREHRRRADGSWRPTTPGSSSSRPTPSTRTAPWPSPRNSRWCRHRRRPRARRSGAGRRCPTS